MTIKNNLFVVALALIPISRLTAQWKEVTPNLTRQYTHMAVLSADTAFIIAETYALSSTELWKTFDGGGHWEKIPLHIGDGYPLFNYDGIVFTDAMHGFLLTHYGIKNGLLWETHDGGHTWAIVSLPPVDKKILHFSGLDFSDSMNGVLMAEQVPLHLVFTTSDGGRTWKEQASLPGSFTRLKMYPDGTGVVHRLGMPRWVWESRDKGQSWAPVPAAEVEENWRFYREEFWEDSEFYASPPKKFRESVRTLGDRVDLEYTFEFSADDGASWNTPALKVYNTLLQATASKDNATWFLFSNVAYRHTYPGQAGAVPVRTGKLEISPNPAVPGAPFRLLEPGRTTDYVQIVIRELVSGNEVYIETYLSGDGRVVIHALPNLPQGFYLVQFLHKGALRGEAKLLVH